MAAGCGGRPLSARTRIAEAIIRDIAAEWERSGAEVLERMARDEPSKFATPAAGLIPREGSRRMVCQLRQSPAEGTIMGGLPRNHRWRAFKFPILWSFWSRSFVLVYTAMQEAQFTLRPSTEAAFSDYLQAQIASNSPTSFLGPRILI